MMVLETRSQPFTAAPYREPGLASPMLIESPSREEVKPDSYQVRVRINPWTPREIWGEYGHLATYQGYSKEQMPRILAAYSLQVNSYYPDRRDPEAITSLSMKIVCDLRRPGGVMLKLHDNMFQSGVQTEEGSYKVTYLANPLEGMAYVHQVRLMRECSGGYETDRILTPKELSELDFPARGLPQEADWIETFGKYYTRVSGKSPAATEYQEVHNQLLVPYVRKSSPQED